MNIYLTYDYELFFGTVSGSLNKCIIEPTNRLREIAQRTGAKLTFFVDVGYLKQLKAFAHFNKVKNELETITNQIRTLVTEGHDCQLHIHPHWEDSRHDGDEWIMNVKRYKLTDFSEEEIERIVLEYQSILMSLTQKPVSVYRAGGWCLQPFSKVKKAFEKANLKMDSSVFFDGKNTIDPYYYDFSQCPNKDYWSFSDELTVEDEKGEFVEFPISSYWYHPLFFWKLFILGRLFPAKHKPIGDGYPVPSKGMKKEMLTKGKLLSASTDGYFVTKMNRICQQNEKKNFKHTVIIGHPKALTYFSLNQLEKAILKAKNKQHQFLTLSDAIQFSN